MLGTPSLSTMPAAQWTSLLQRFDVPGPRYTSYPTADRFVEAFDRSKLVEWIQKRGIGATSLPLSVYVHIPFCESVCYYCACNKIVTRRHGEASVYLRYLKREIGLYAHALGGRPAISQLHLGGGTPTFLSDDELRELMGMIDHGFSRKEDGEYAIEVDPRTVDAQRLRTLRELGFNRLSFGVQDFDERVQRAVHRVQSTEQVFGLLATARTLGFESINVDLIYGLPLQTRASFHETLETLCRLRPDRIALYAYAHLPERFKPQRRITAADLPSAADRVAMLRAAIERLAQAGYVHIGMDHFALPEDALAVAKRQGRVHRNFQGYSTQPDCDLIGLGVSAIGKMGPTYSQNARTLADYYDRLDQGVLPLQRGIELSRDDLARRAVIMALMCQGRLSIEAIELSHLLDFETAFARELDELRRFADAGLVEIGDGWIQVTPAGMYFVRAIAMVFDRHLHASRPASAGQRVRFSKIL
jgi:oxygen-independent coproporphyrinogen-3 oxidase